MHRRSRLAQSGLVPRPSHIASRIRAITSVEEQAVERAVGFIAGTGIGKLGNRRVLERRRRIADLAEAIDSAGPRKAMRDTLDTTERVRQPVSIFRRHAILRKRRRIPFDPQQESSPQVVHWIVRRLYVTAY